MIERNLQKREGDKRGRVTEIEGERGSKKDKQRKTKRERERSIYGEREERE